MTRQFVRCQCTALIFASLLCAAATVAFGQNLVDTFDPFNPARVSTQAGSAPAPTVTAGGPTGNFLRLINEGAGSQHNFYAYDRTAVGAFNRVTSSFDFRGFSPDQPADGFSYVLLPTATQGITGTFTGYTAESPNVAGALGVGFHTYSGARNSVSLHWNNAQLMDMNIPQSDVNFRPTSLGPFHRATVDALGVAGGSVVTVQLTNDVNGTSTPTVSPYINFYVAGMSPYENRAQLAGRTGGANMTADFDNIAVNYSSATKPPLAAGYATAQNFSGSGTFFVTTAASGTAAPSLLGGGPTGNYLRLMHDGVNSQNNSIVFDATYNAAYANSAPSIIGDFDFRAQNAAGDAGDGFSLVLLPTASYGTTGPHPGPGFTAEEPNLAGAFALGVDFYQNLNNISAHFNGAQLAENAIPTGTINLDSGVFHHMHFELTEQGPNTLLDVIVTPDNFGIPGAPVTVFNDLLIPGMNIYDFRAMFAGRTGGADMTVDIDNLQVLMTPEPASSALWIGVGLCCVFAGWRQIRRKQA